ncbi:MAG: transglycosylase domain-containing protein, partial [Proteobacteria bacterium]|nr:transglycosylase domain-containing protein [Pseudomonadota bacterium]
GSLVANLKADRVVRGGSTISQQVVKNLFLNHDKTLSRKFQEAFLTWQMEKTLPKIRIFELYLNLAHWAKDIYGIREAAAFYFSKTVSQLSLREALFLASILPNPIIFGKQYAQNELSSSRIQKMVNVGNALRATNRISASAWEAALPLIREGKISDRPRPVVDW